MKPAYLVALAALGFVGGAVLLSVNRKPAEAAVARSAPETSAAPAAPSPAAPPPDKSEPDAAARAEQNHHLGLAAFLNKDYDLAISYFTEALRTQPGYLDALWGRCGAYSGMGNWAKVCADATEIIRLTPEGKEKGRAYGFRALSYAGLGDQEAVIQDCTNAIRLGYVDAAVYEYRANALWERHQYGRAIADASTAIRLNPKSDHAYLVRGKAYVFKEMHEQAAKDFAAALAIRPSCDGYCFRGNLHAAIGDWAAALRDGKSSVTLDPNYAPGHMLLARCYAKFGDQRSAAWHSNRSEELRHQQGQR